MTKLRSKLISYQNKNNATVICPISRFKCKLCPMTLMGNCGNLESFLDTGEWK